ncbi:MAG: porin family protein [Bacteroidales bacterium]|nr:porin family protein [Bacteroidales bacterium]
MKSIKKISLVVLAAVLSITFANAQVGVQAGYSMMKSTVDNSKASNGFHVGPIYNMSLQGPISLQYGLLYNLYVASSSTDKVLNSWVTTTNTNHQIDIPVRVAGTFPLSSGLSAFVFAGPNFNLGLAGKTSVATYVDGKKSDKLSGSGKDIYEDKDLSRFNLQLGLGAGLQFNNMGVKASYDFGLLDMYKSDLLDYKVNGLKVGLFYNF